MLRMVHVQHTVFCCLPESADLSTSLADDHLVHEDHAHCRKKKDVHAHVSRLGKKLLAEMSASYEAFF